MSVFTRMSHYVRHYRTTLNRRRTERLIGTLPPEIRKDIGWPAHYTSVQSDGLDNRSISRF